MKLNLIGVDTSKDTFTIAGVNHAGRVLLHQTVKRPHFLKFIGGLERDATIALEACWATHYWARECVKLGFKVLLVPAQFTKMYRKSQKNDTRDAEAVAEAAQRPEMRFVAIKNESQQSMQGIHRIRERWIAERTATMNQARGLLGEFGIFSPQGVGPLRLELARIAAGEGNVPPELKETLAELYHELKEIEERIARVNRRLKALCAQNPDARRVDALGGVGFITATAIVAKAGDPQLYKNGRAFAASLGLVPRQFTTAGKLALGSLTKRGDSYIRKLLIHGARAYIRFAARHNDPYSLWIRSLQQRKGTNLAAVALANKNARIIWALLARNEQVFDPLKAAA